MLEGLQGILCLMDGILVHVWAGPGRSCSKDLGAIPSHTVYVKSFEVEKFRRLVRSGKFGGIVS